MKIRVKILFAAAAAALATFVPSVSHAAIFGASNASATTFFNGDDRAPFHTIDESGLAAGLHDNSIGHTMYLSDNEANPTITWDFGKNYSVTGFHLWNYNEIFSNNTDFRLRGIQSAEVQISNFPNFSAFTSLGTMTFNPGTGQTGYAGDDYTLPTPGSGRYMRFTNVGKFANSDNYTGLSEINFQGTLAPRNLIQPIGANASSFYPNDDRNPGHTIDSSTSEHSNSPGSTMWLALPSDASPMITWDLGSSQTLEGFRLWNYNENSGNPAIFLKRGVSTARVLVSDVADFSSGVTDLGVMTFNQATGTNLYSGSDYNFNLNAIANGRYVRFTEIDDFGGDGYIGLSEIRFLGVVPEPASIGLLALAGSGFLGRRRK